MEPQKVKVSDDTERARFVLADEGLDGELVYRVEGNRLVLVHAEVAPSLRGQGIAGQLVEAAVDRARRTGESLAPWCGYTRRWLKDHAQEVSDVDIDWRQPFEP